MARSNVDYTPSAAGFKAMRNGPEIQAVCVAVAEKAKGYAVSIAPRDSGEYASSFQVDRITVIFTSGPGKGPRVGARLVNKAPYAAAVEWRHGHRVLGRTLDFLAGLR